MPARGTLELHLHPLDETFTMEFVLARCLHVTLAFHLLLKIVLTYGNAVKGLKPEKAQTNHA
jgi:hypothetical protein